MAETDGKGGLNEREKEERRGEAREEVETRAGKRAEAWRRKARKVSCFKKNPTRPPPQPTVEPSKRRTTTVKGAKKRADFFSDSVPHSRFPSRPRIPSRIQSENESLRVPFSYTWGMRRGRRRRSPSLTQAPFCLFFLDEAFSSSSSSLLVIV